MIKVKKIDKIEDIDRKTWSEVLKLAKTNYLFQTYEFVSAWWTNFGKNRKDRSLLLLIVEDGGSIVAIAPLMITKMPFINSGIIQFIGTDICDYMDFIIDKRDYETYFLKLIDYISTLNFLEVDLRYIPEDSETLRNFDKISEYQVKTSQIDLCPYISLKNGLKEVREGIKNKLRKEIYKNEEKLSEKGELIFRNYSGSLPGREIWEKYFELHIKKWRYYSKKYSQFQFSYWRDFIAELSASLAEKNWLDFSYLEFNKNMVASHFGFRYNKKLYYYMPTFDTDFAVYSPAKILIMKMLEDISAKGFEEFDFLRGAESYKMVWTDFSRPIYNICYYNKSRLLKYSGIIYALLRRSYLKDIKPILKRVKPLMNIWYGLKKD